MSMDREKGTYVSRRAVPVGLGAAAPAGTVTGASVLGASEPDAELIPLGRQFDAICKSIQEGCSDLEHRRAQYEAQEPLKPDALKRQIRDPVWLRNPVSTGEYYCLDHVVRFAEAPGAGYVNGPHRQKACERAAEICAALDSWTEECDQLSERLGIDALEEHLDQEDEKLDAVMKAIREAPATSIAGLAVKARVAASGRDEEMSEIIVAELSRAPL